MRLLAAGGSPLAGIPLVLAFAIAPCAAVEAPLSRAAFDRAIEEGRSCRGTKKEGFYVVKKGTAPLLEQILVAVIQSFVADETSESFVTLRLATPYTRVRLAACQAKLFGGSFDAEAAWASARTSATVTIQIETKTVSKPTRPLTADAEEKYGLTPGSPESGGPFVTGVALRRGEGEGATTVGPLGECNLQCEFPATALHGEGPFFLVLRTADSDRPIVLQLKPSLLRRP
jgi:hypothetical protein